MKTAHRQAARAKAAQKHALFDPRADLHPREIARRKKRAAEQSNPPQPAWQASWQPLTTEPAPVHRPGADDYLRCPSRVGGTVVPYHIAATQPEPTP